jgi:GR25 family glycosyltransferase involved in LPS biosynthesis
MSLSHLPNIYEYIDHIVYINLDHRTDRREHIESQFQQYGIHTYERFPAWKHDIGIIGCTYSHQAVYKMAKEKGYRNILIFEDDFEFTVSPIQFWTFIQTMFQSNKSWDVCLLSYHAQEIASSSSCPQRVTTDSNIEYRRILQASVACGYIVQNHYYDTLIELYNTGIPLLEQTGQHWHYANDQYWKQLQQQDQWYGAFPRIGKQIAGYSDNSKCYMSNDDW